MRVHANQSDMYPRICSFFSHLFLGVSTVECKAVARKECLAGGGGGGVNLSFTSVYITTHFDLLCTVTIRANWFWDELELIIRNLPPPKLYTSVFFLL